MKITVALFSVVAIVAAGCGDRNQSQDSQVPDPDSGLDYTIVDFPHPVDGPLDGPLDGPRDVAPPDYSNPDWPQNDHHFMPDFLFTDWSGPSPDLYFPTDGPPPKCPPFSGIIGKPCTTSGACGAGYQCMMLTTTSGICTRNCIPDNKSTPLINEDNCPTGNICGKLTSGSTVQNYCFRTCNPQIGCSECHASFACHPASGNQVGLPRGKTACLAARCKTGADCPVTTGTCNTSLMNCPTGQTCSALTTGSTDGICTRPGVCDVVSGLCNTHPYGKAGAKVGDSCKGDTDCGGNMYCLMELDENKYLKKTGVLCTKDSECCSGSCAYGTCGPGICKVRYRNGYCTTLGCSFSKTLTSRTCDATSTCNHLYGSGFCMKKCSLTQAATCRGNTKDLWGDYECRAWNNLSLGGGLMGSASPVCDLGTAITCSIFWNSYTDCSILGDSTNSTGMACRDFKGTQLTNKYSPSGFCFDSTGSGTTYRP